MRVGEGQDVILVVRQSQPKRHAAATPCWGGACSGLARWYGQKCEMCCQLGSARFAHSHMPPVSGALLSYRCGVLLCVLLWRATAHVALYCCVLLLFLYTLS
jgi:hypothetical protein